MSTLLEKNQLNPHTLRLPPSEVRSWKLGHLSSTELVPGGPGHRWEMEHPKSLPNAPALMQAMYTSWAAHDHQLRDDHLGYVSILSYVVDVF